MSISSLLCRRCLYLRVQIIVGKNNKYSWQLGRVSIALVSMLLKTLKTEHGTFFRSLYTETQPKLNRDSTETQSLLSPSLSLATYYPKTPRRLTAVSPVVEKNGMVHLEAALTPHPRLMPGMSALVTLE